jgi:hypothetical protein
MITVFSEADTRERPEKALYRKPALVVCLESRLQCVFKLNACELPNPEGQLILIHRARTCLCSPKK